MFGCFIRSLNGQDLPSKVTLHAQNMGFAALFSSMEGNYIFFCFIFKKMKVEPERLLTHRAQKKCKPNQKCRMINCISNYNKSLIHFHLNWIFFLRCSLMLCSLFTSFLLFLSHNSSLLSQRNTGLFCKFYEYIYNIDNEMMNLDGNCGFIL